MIKDPILDAIAMVLVEWSQNPKQFAHFIYIKSDKMMQSDTWFTGWSLYYTYPYLNDF